MRKKHVLYTKEKTARKVAMDLACYYIVLLEVKGLGQGWLVTNNANRIHGKKVNEIQRIALAWR